jgi:hypothetical protein
MIIMPQFFSPDNPEYIAMGRIRAAEMVEGSNSRGRIVEFDGLDRGLPNLETSQ